MISLQRGMVPSDNYERRDGIDVHQAALELTRGETVSLVLRECVSPQASLVAAAFAVNNRQPDMPWRQLLGAVRGIGPQRLRRWCCALQRVGIDPELWISRSSPQQRQGVVAALIQCSDAITDGVNTIHRVLREHNDPKRWLLCREFSWPVPESYGGRRRADLLALDLLGEQRIIYEIKVDHRDLRAELSRPDKSLPAMWVAQRFVLVTPPGLVQLQQLKPEMGLLEVDLLRGTLQHRRAAPCRQLGPPPQELLLGLERWMRGAAPREQQQAQAFLERWGPGAPRLGSP